MLILYVKLDHYDDQLYLNKALVIFTHMAVNTIYMLIYKTSIS